MNWAFWIFTLVSALTLPLACNGETATPSTELSVEAREWLATLKSDQPDRCLSYIIRFPRNEYAEHAAQRMWWLLKQQMDAAGPQFSVARRIALRPLRKDFLPVLIRSLPDFPPYGPYVWHGDAAPYPWLPRIDNRWWLYGLPVDERARISQELFEGQIAQVASRDNGNQSAACRALGDLGNPAALKALLDVVKSGGDPSCCALLAIGELRSPLSKPFLLARIEGYRAAPTATDTLPAIYPELDALAALRDPDTVPLMVELTRSGHIGICQKACEALGVIGDSRGLQALLDRAGDEQEDERVRRTAIDAIGRIGDSRAVPLLAAMLKSEEFHDVSINSLGKITTAESVRVLAEDIVRETGILARLPSQALAACDHPDSAPSLLAALYKKPVGHLSFTMADEGRDPIFDGAEEEYRRFSCGTCAMLVWSFQSIDRLLAALDDERESVRGSAAYAIALAPVRDPRTVNVLVPLLKDEALAASAAFALGSFGDVRAVEPLIDALGRDDLTLRRFAAHALGDLGDPRAMGPLLKLLDDEDVRFAAVEALRDMKAQQAAPRLASMLKEMHDPSPEPIWNSNETPETITFVDPSVNPPANRFLTSVAARFLILPIGKSLPRKLYRRDLLEALRWIGNPAVAPVLLEIAKDHADPLRDEALRLFFEIGHGADAEVLFELASDQVERVRSEVAVALGKAGDKRATKLLLPLLKDRRWQTLAAEALGRTRDQRAVAPLLALLSESKNDGLRRAAIEALGHIGDCSATESLLKHLECARAASEDAGSVYWDSTAVKRALVAIGDERAIEPLLAPWKQGKELLDSEFIEDFAGTKMLDAVAAVMLDLSYDKKIRADAAVRLGYAERPETLPALRKALRDPEGEVRRSACCAIWRIRPPEGDEVEAMLFDPDLTSLAGSAVFDELKYQGRFPRNADEAVRYLILIGARYDLIALWPRTKRLLFADLHSDSPDRQLYAARSLIRIGYGDETIPELVAALEGSDDERMAHDFVNSGNQQLRQAAITWSVRTGGSLDSQRPAELAWGAMKEP